MTRGEWDALLDHIRDAASKLACDPHPLRVEVQPFANDVSRLVLLAEALDAGIWHPDQDTARVQKKNDDERQARVAKMPKRGAGGRFLPRNGA
jgi:hypothetical protein